VLSLVALLAGCPAAKKKEPAYPRSLPFTYERADVGTPVTAAELAAVTDHYLELLDKTRYFRFIDDRAHGWPESDPQGRYWYGTWWSGVSVHKQNGQVTYTHSADGADNNGLRTAPVLEGACYAYALWKTPESQHLTRKLLRGFNSWFLAMQTGPTDTLPLLSRAAYPPSIDSNEGGRNLHINYDADRPGVDADPTIYIHVPNNPSWGDLWTKNKRSKDDIGHMLRALAQLDTCAELFSDAAAKSELEELKTRFTAWSQRVIQNNWSIETRDKDLSLVIPPDDLAHFSSTGGFECGSQLAIQLNANGSATGLDCADGDLFQETESPLQNSAMQIIRTFQEAVASEAILANQPELAKTFLTGLAARVEKLMDYSDANGGQFPRNASSMDVAALLLHAANAGVPLTSREVRWLHARVEEAHTSYLSPAQAANYDLFAATTPDGDYSFDASGSGLDFKDLGVLLGTCAAEYRNPKGRPVLDCDRVRAWAGKQ
jgi:hypothetical protein